jgi:hypothetical protein
MRNSVQRVDLRWAHRELIPFLMEVYREHRHQEHWGIADWVRSVHIAEEHLDDIVNIRTTPQPFRDVLSHSSCVPQEEVA